MGSKIRQIFSSIGEWLNDQQWFQELRAKWDELDPQSKTYLKFGGAAAAVVGIMFIVLSAMWSVRSLKQELAEKNDLINLMQSASDEMRRLREATPAAATGGRPGEQADTPWNTYLESVAANAGIEKEKLNIGAEKAADGKTPGKEVLFEVGLKNVNIKQVVRYAYLLESGPRPLKLRNMSVDTKPDMSGYLDAMLSVSGFKLKE